MEMCLLKALAWRYAHFKSIFLIVHLCSTAKESNTGMDSRFNVGPLLLNSPFSRSVRLHGTVLAFADPFGFLFYMTCDPITF